MSTAQAESKLHNTTSRDRIIANSLIEYLPDIGVVRFFGDYKVVIKGRYDCVSVVDALRPLFAEG